MRDENKEQQDKKQNVNRVYLGISKSLWLHHQHLSLTDLLMYSMQTSYISNFDGMVWWIPAMQINAAHDVILLSEIIFGENVVLTLWHYSCVYIMSYVGAIHIHNVFKNFTSASARTHALPHNTIVSYKRIASALKTKRTNKKSEAKKLNST